MGGLMYIFIRKFTKVRSVADAARRAKSGIGQILTSLVTAAKLADILVKIKPISLLPILAI
jgi:hypothetical protein